MSDLLSAILISVSLFHFDPVPDPPGEAGGCEDSSGPVCGNGICAGEEKTLNCPIDCPPVLSCGDGRCDLGESEHVCPGDCVPFQAGVCGNLVCDPNESPDECATDCLTAQVCGDGKCESQETPTSCAQDCGGESLAQACTPTGTRPLELAADLGTYLLLNDTLDKSWSDWEDAVSTLRTYMDVLYAIHDDDIDFLFFTRKEGKGGPSARPLSSGPAWNGSHNEPLWFRPTESRFWPPSLPFDLSPSSRLEGLVFLESAESYFNSAGTPGGNGAARMKLAVTHELGHYFLAKALFDDGSDDSNMALLGGELNHWGLYVATGRSPMYGLDWQDLGEGIFSAPSKHAPYDYAFSPLDLYLMGMVPPEEVPDWFVIEDVTACWRDDVPCACPSHTKPAYRLAPGTYTVQGRRRDASIDQVEASLGPQQPSFDTHTIRVAFLFGQDPGEPISADERIRYAQLFDWAVQGWNEATGGRSQLVNVSRSWCNPGE